MPRRLLAILALCCVAVLGLRGAEAASQDAPGAAASAREVPLTAGAPRADGPPLVLAPDDTPATSPLARVGEVELHMPSDDVLLVGYHEASRDGALELQPVGRGRSNENTTKYRLPADEAHGEDYHVMSSRGRVLPATSAVDVVMRDDDPVLSPVTGTVTDVRPYALYDVHADTRIEIEPDGAPHLRLVVIHVDGVEVAVGDRVLAGRSTLAATANRFPFTSHVDRYLDRAWPHVHLEVKDLRLAD